ncbi:MAG TPA: patatin-like protein [Acidimicrobiales bacterium]|nr:patatin-like protein [Acidimicrobiales bacterium]
MELRLALAMRGGVSLAVWIGGAVSEIDLVRRAGRRRMPAAGSTDFWQEVMRGATLYDSVVVDVLAGASAGGLNGVLYAASQVYDFPYGAMRDIWLTVGGTEGLVRRNEPWPSLFKGDDYFLATVHQKLAALTTSAAAEPADGSRPRVELALSATMMEPVVRPLPSPEDEPLVERRHAGGFRFRQPEEPWLPTDFPARNDPQFPGTLWRLAVAARSTSSYPGAFEAAEVRSCRRRTFTSPPPASAAGPDVDLDGTFLDRTTGRPFVVADGGILDNIPIRAALDFVANAPAAGPTERFLVYLQPGASTSPKNSADLGEDERRTTMAVLRGVLAARVAGETINEDIAAIEAYNEAIARATTLRQATLGLLGDRKQFLEAADAGHSTYRLTRAAHEARQLFGLLLDPMDVMGEDQFPQAVAGTAVDDARWRSPIAAWPQQDREGLEAALSGRLEGMLRRPEAGLLACTGDVGPLLRVTDLLIEWARWVERTVPAAGNVKRRLYRVRTFLGAILDRTRRLAWVSAAACTEGDYTGFAARSVRALQLLSKVDASASDATVEALRTGAKGPLEAVCAEALARVDGVVAEAVRGASETRDDLATAGHDLLVEIARLLVELVAPLAAAAPDRSPPDAHLEPGQLLHRVLGGEAVTIEALEALDVLCLQEFVSGLPGRRRVDFRRLSTAARTPLAQHFATLLDQAEKDGLWWDPSVDRQGQQGIHVTLKLAGNELANFSAFLLAHWRANDWLWGRLDAVPTMIEMLVRPSHLRERLARCADDEAAVEAVHQLVAPAGHPWRARLDTLVWAPSVAAVRQEVAKLRRPTDGSEEDIPAVRTALVARRQWEILGEERALPSDQMGVRPGVDPGRPPTLEEVEAWVADYGVGAEVLRGNERAPELLDRFGEIATAATEMALWNVSLPSSRVPRPPRLVATALRRAGPRLGRRLAKSLVVVPAPTQASRTKARIALAVAVLVVLGVLGWFVDKWAFVLGFVFAFLPLGVLGVAGYRRIRKLLDTG